MDSDTIFEIIFTGVLSLIFLSGLIFLFVNYRKTKHNIMLLLALFYLFCILESVFQAIESIVDSITDGWIGWFYLIGKWMIVPRTLVLIAVFEFMARDSIRKGLIAYWALLTGIMVVLDIIWMWVDSNYVPELFFVKRCLDVPSDFAYYLLILIILFGAYTAFQIKKHAPPSLGKPSRLYFLGFLVAGVALALFEIERIVSLLESLSSISKMLNPSVDLAAFDTFLAGLEGSTIRYIAAAFIGVGVIIISVVLVKNPRIAYVLPLQVLRLSAFDMKSGNAYFTHTWEAGKNFIDEDVFTGMLQGIRCIIKESMNQGDLKEIITESATILINKQKDVSVLFFLITRIPTKMIRNVLNNFAREFSIQFADLFDKVVPLEEFSGANSLVEKFFPFS